MVHSQVTAIGNNIAQTIRYGATASVTVYESHQYGRLNYYHDIADILAYYSESFVGRDEECKRILNFHRSCKPGYMLVEALPGYGKTALIAYLVNTMSVIKPKNQSITLYYFIRKDRNQNTPLHFLQAINSQLLHYQESTGCIGVNLSKNQCIALS